VDKSKIDVEVVDQVVKLKGTRSVPTFDPDAHEGEGPTPGPTAAGTGAAGSAAPTEHRRIRIHLMEIDHGSFCREVELPEDVDRERISATYRNGMLWIELPKVTPGSI
jgi:HSP20 family protein